MKVQFTPFSHVENCIFKLNHEHIRLQFDKVLALCAITKNIFKFAGQMGHDGQSTD